LVTRLVSSIQLGRRERERGIAHDAFSLRQSRTGRESHWFNIKRSKNHEFGDSRPIISTLACFFFIFFFYKPNFIKLGLPSWSSLTNFNWVQLIEQSYCSALTKIPQMIKKKKPSLTWTVDKVNLTYSDKLIIIFYIWLKINYW